MLSMLFPLCPCPAFGYSDAMPKKNQKIDSSRSGKRDASDARREEVAQATLAVIARDGLDRASMRGIAQEIGCSTGVLTHYFRDKDAILDFALQSIINAVESSGEGATGVLTLDQFAAEVSSALPDSLDNRQLWKVWINFTAASLSRPEQHRRHHLLYEGIRDHWSKRLVSLSEAGAFSEPIDADEEAALLFCLIDGIGIQALISPRLFVSARQHGLVRAHLTRLPWVATASVDQ